MISKLSVLKQVFEMLSESDIEKFQILVNRLIGVGYITAEKDEDKNNYYFIVSYLEGFKSYFEIAGMELVHYQTTKTLILKNNFLSKVSLNKISSIIFLIIRLLYQQKLHEASLTREIIITVREIQEKYEQLNINNDERIKKSDLEDTLRILKKHNIINYKGMDVQNDDFLIVVYSTIKYVLEINDLEQLLAKLNSYKMGDEVDEEITED